MQFKELPLKERYDRILDDLALSVILSYVHAQEFDTVDKLNDLYVMANKKMLPSYLGVSIKIFFSFISILKNAPDYTHTR